MKIVHISDTHLGFAAYRKLSESGLNQRQEDIKNAFFEAVDKILEIQPTLLLHTGDLFDSPRPSNLTIYHAITAFMKLSKEGIPSIIISGNHDTPKTKELGSVFSILEVIPNVHPVHKGQYECIKVKDVLVHAVPQCANNDALREQIKRVRPCKEALNILLLHAAIEGVKEFSQGGWGEQYIRVDEFFEDFDYVALGHLHRFAKVAPKTYFSGSTERLSFAEAGQRKGFLEVRLNGGVTFHTLSTREMLELPILYARGLTQKQIMERIEECLSCYSLEGKIVRMKIEGVEEESVPEQVLWQLKAKMKDALHFEVQIQVERKGVVFLRTSIGKVEDEFVQYLLEKGEKDEEIKRMGLEYLGRSGE